MAHVFGPIQSRRLGRSLGIDPIPLKTCNWNCVYCQLGRTKPLVVERADYAPPEVIVAETLEVLQGLQSSSEGVDWVTFAGSGEPTLHQGLGLMIQGIKAACSTPVAVITNGSLLYLEQVRAAVGQADAVLPSLDAGSDDLYRRIVRPHKEASFERLVDGLLAFRSMYRGKLWIETMLVPGLNDGEEALEALARVVGQIGPDELHLNVAVRPPAEDWVTSPPAENLALAMEILGRVVPVLAPNGRGAFSLDLRREVEPQILGVLTRHPLAEEVVHQGLSVLGSAQATHWIEALVQSGKIQRVERSGIAYLATKEARFG